MNCVSSILGDLQARGWVHHIPRLMVLGNLALIAGVNPQQFTRWMWDSFVDAAEWVMVPNVIGMSLHADGGKMASKPYAAGGAYIDRMSDYCKSCAYDRTKRVGDDACPFTTLYWDFMLRHADRFVKNPRMSTQIRAAQKLADGDAIRQRAQTVLTQLRQGTL
jgi:deoxyribodipyrimidine photolyase-related protein